jgi:hypothetical protein
MGIRKASKAEKTTEKPESLAERSVKKYKEAEDELKNFMKDEEYKGVLQAFYQLVEERNVALDEAVRSVKSELQRSDQPKLIIGGIGAQKRMKRYYDTNFLAEHLPVKQAELILTEKIVYELNEPMLEQLARQGEVDNDVVREAYHEEPQNPAALPGTPKPYDVPPIPIFGE